MRGLEQIEGIDSQSEEISVAQKYSALTEQYPQFALHLNALDQLGRKARFSGLSEEIKEQLVWYSLWVEDPVTTTAVAESLGVSERTLNEYVDTCTFELGQFGEAILGVAENIRTPKIIPSTHSINLPFQESTEDTSSATHAEETYPVSPIYSESKEIERQVPPGQLVQSYDHPILTREQEQVLFKYLRSTYSLEELRQDKRFINTFTLEDRPKITRILNESASVEEVVCSCYLRLTNVIARRYHDLPLSEAMNIGQIGLMKAGRRYDPSGEAKFSTYAVWDIRSAIVQEAYGQRSSIRIPLYVQQDLAKALWVSESFEHVFGKKPTINELRKQLLANTNMPRWRVDTVLQVLISKIQNVRSLNEPLTFDSEEEVGDFIPDKSTSVEKTVLDEVANAELQQEVKRAVSEHLTAEEQRVVIALYDLDRSGEVPIQTLGQRIGKTKTELEQIERRALAKLRYDKWLREHWQEHMPYFVYSRSAERAAFELGLFDDELEAKIQTLEQQLGLESEVIFDGTVSGQQEASTLEPPHEVTRLTDSIDLEHTAKQTSSDAQLEIVPNMPSELPDHIKRIVELYTQGIHLSQIAEDLGTTERMLEHTLQSYGVLAVQKNGGSEQSVELINPVVSEIKRDPNSKIEKVKQLRNQGYKNQEIADLLGISYGAVGQYVFRLLRNGEVVPHRTFRRERSKRNHRTQGRTIDRVKELLIEGLNHNQIAEKLGISSSTVSVYKSKLSKTGEIPQLPRNRRQSQPKKTKLSEAEERADAVSEETELVRKHLEANPRPTYKEGFTIIFEAREKRLRGRKPETVEFDKRVLELLLQGYTRKEAGEKLGTPETTIDSSVTRMVNLGEYTPGRALSSERVKKRSQYSKTRQRILEMIQQGQDVVQIADVLDDTLQHVQGIVRDLRRDGDINPTTEQLRPANRTGYVDKRANVPISKLSEIYEKVAEMRRKGMSNGEIAEALNLPQHRVEVYASTLIRAGVIQLMTRRSRNQVGYVDPNVVVPKGKMYEKVEELRKKGLTNAQIAKQLSINRQTVGFMASRLIRAGVIKPLRASVGISTVREEFLSKVKELRNQSNGNAEIARLLSLSIDRVKSLARELIQTGEIQKLRGGRPKKISDKKDTVLPIEVSNMDHMSESTEIPEVALKNLLERINALKTPDTSAEFQAGDDTVSSLVQEEIDRERIQKIEAELAILHAKHSLKRKD